MRIALAFLVLAAALSLASMQWRTSAAAPEIVTAQRAGEPPTNAAETSEAPIAEHSQLDANAPPPPPLFRAAQAPTEQAGPQPGETFALVGLAGDRENRLAFVRDLGDQQTFRVRLGDHVGAWSVEEIDTSCVALRRGRHTQRVCL